MAKSAAPVILTSFALFTLTVAPFLDLPVQVSSWIFTLSPLLIIWMVISVLKDKPLSDKKFSDGHWYEDYDINRVDEKKDAV